MHVQFYILNSPKTTSSMSILRIKSREVGGSTITFVHGTLVKLISPPLGLIPLKRSPGSASPGLDDIKPFVSHSKVRLVVVDMCAKQC